MSIPNEELGVVGTEFLLNPDNYDFKGNVAVIGGGAVAVDCAIVAKRGGAKQVEMFALEKLGEMP